jgi:uncharacterized protein (TIGR04255 family)
MGKRYANPPLVEAVCEFRLAAETLWDLAIPGLLYEKIKNKFPIREQRTVQEVELVSGATGLQQQVRANERMMLFTRDKNCSSNWGHDC